MSPFLNRLRWAPLTASAHLTAWGIFLALMGCHTLAGILLFTCGFGGAVLVWADYSKAATGHISDLRALVSGYRPTMANILGLACHVPQGIAGGFLLREFFLDLWRTLL